MGMKLIFDFDDEWTAKLGPMIQDRVEGLRRNPLVVEILQERGFDSIDDLTLKQKTRLWVRLQMLREMIKYEGQKAADAANRAAVGDLRNKFPLDVGSA